MDESIYGASGAPLNFYEQTRFDEMVANYGATSPQDETVQWKKWGDATLGMAMVAESAAIIAVSPIEGIPEQFSVPEFGFVTGTGAILLAAVGLAMRIKSRNPRAK